MLEKTPLPQGIIRRIHALLDPAIYKFMTREAGQCVCVVCVCKYAVMGIEYILLDV